MRKRTLPYLTVLLALPTIGWAQEKPLSIEDELLALLNAKVVVASKSAESVSDAPGLITAYQAKQLDMLGAWTLADLANLTPGYSSYRIYGEQVLETRGQKAGSFNNNKHFMMIDGIPVEHARAYKVPIDDQLPLFFADRVEFLRGPASALYGVGAFYGVINIQPKASREGGTRAESMFALGDDGASRQFNSTFTASRPQSDSHLSVSASHKQDSLDYVGTVNSPNNLFRDGHTSLFMYASHKLTAGPLEGLGLGVIYQYKRGGLGEYWNEAAFTSPLNDLTWSTLIPYVKYDTAINDRLHFSSYLKFNESQEKGVDSPFGSTDYTTYNGTGRPLNIYDVRIADVAALAELRWKASDRVDVIGGVNRDTRWQRGLHYSSSYDVSADPGLPYPGGDLPKTGDYTTTSAYLQGRIGFDVLAGLNMVLGVRSDNGSAPGNTYHQLSPRLGLVQKLDENWVVKVLHGSALRAPGIKEVELNKESSAAHSGLNLPSLSAEQFATDEVAVAYHRSGWGGTLAYFSNKTTDALDGASVSGVNVFQNSNGTTKAKGVELELQATAGSWASWFNYSVAKAETPTGGEVEDVPTQKANFILNRQFEWGVPLQATLMAHWVKDWTQADPAKPRVEGFTTLDARFGMPHTQGLSLTLQVRNLTDKRYKLPKHGVPDVPMPGRTLVVDLGMRF
ncbi:TonB-dependent siderophore receptor [Geothrix sp. PMB-07]|uniref:TonB-dependent receptor plug domain-containing protein n=1 Tax=Geothrix sp. PMB-07 TaxID=3068640 RepID=UPI00274249A3|nr:TonB-dependent receptor [Geothrix sp. PMB-07]WLT30499.1 TonB-dependent receptor [Geothrix sp. PMB-07]